MSIAQKLINISNPQNVIIGSGFIALDFGVQKESIYKGNLTDEQIKAIDICDSFEARSQFLYGFKDRKLVFECYASFWNTEEVKEHLQYFKDKTRNVAHWELNTRGFYINNL